MTERKLIVRTADQSRRADIDYDAASTGGEIIQAAVDNWALPADMDYTLVNTTTGQVLSPLQSLDQQVSNGDVLEVQPVLVAGNENAPEAPAAPPPLGVPPADRQSRIRGGSLVG